MGGTPSAEADLAPIPLRRANTGSFTRQLLRALRKRYWRASYSQFGEDVVLQNLFAGRDRGVFVDVGCFHPKKYSNTYALYKRGWSGVNVDTSSLKIRLFDALRPRDHNAVAAVTDRPREVTLYKFGELSVLDTIDEETAKLWKVKFELDFEEERIRGLPLNDIIAEAKLPGTGIDLLSIDVEGHELSILETFDFAAYRPEVVVVELHARDLEEVLGADLYDLLRARGYRLTHWLNPSLIFQYGDEEASGAEPGRREKLPNRSPGRFQ